MTDSPARPLILISGVALALFDLVALLPGNPVVDSVPGFTVVIAAQALIIWRLLHRSGLAWFFGVFFPSAYALTSFLFQNAAGEETTLMMSAVLMLAVVALLCAPPVLAYIWHD